MSRTGALNLVVLACVGAWAASCGQEEAAPAGGEHAATTASGDPAHDATGAAARGPTLAPEVTAYLWDLEHHGNLLGAHGFSQLARLAVDGDTAGLAAACSPSFEGSTLATWREIVVSGDGFHGERRERGDREAAPLSADAFAELLVGLRQSIAGEPRFKWGVKRISPTDRTDLDRPWMAKCALRMWGPQTDGGGPIEHTVLFVAEVARPSKARMAEPGWLLRFDVLEQGVARAGATLFHEALADYGVDRRWFHDNWRARAKRHVGGCVYALDFDRDHCVDLLVTDPLPQGNLLLKGRPGGGFDDVTAAVGLTEMQIDAALDVGIADLDGDGWEDLVFGSGEIYRNAEGVRFERVTEQSNYRSLGCIPDAPGKRATITVTDFDRDGLLDLYIVRGGGFPTSWLEDAGDSPYRNVLLRNVGDWTFEDVTEEMGLDGGPRSSFTAVWFDADGDLWPDCYVINEFGDGALFVNEEGRRFREMDADPAMDDFGSMGAVAGDVDNDGNIDVYVAAMFSKAGSRVMGNLPPEAYPDEIDARLWRLISGSEFYRNRGDLVFEAQAVEQHIHAVGWAWGPAMADFDNDGWLDIYAPAGYMSRDRGKPDG